VRKDKDQKYRDTAAKKGLISMLAVPMGMKRQGDMCP